MNNSSEKIGGTNFKPSARKSIHHYKQQFAEPERMGRHGLCATNNTPVMLRHASNLDNADAGKDEVDNIMSKLRHKRQIPRRKSYDLSCEGINDSDNELVVLAKSLPTHLPSQLHYSGEWPQETDDENNVDAIEHDVSRNSELDLSPQRPKYMNRKNTINGLLNESEVHREHKSPHAIIFAAVTTVAGILIVYSNFPVNISDGNEITNYDTHQFYYDIISLGGKYGISKNSLLQVQIGISTIFEKQDTGSFIFAYNSKSHNFNSRLFDIFLEDISRTSAKFLRNETVPISHLVVESSDLHMGTHGELINRYRNDVSRAGVMLMKDVDKVPSALAMAFHYYCDEFNPLVRKSAIFFTLDLASCNNSVAESQSIHSMIEKCLTNKWSSGVPADNIKPLLTRVVSVVVDLSDAF